MRKARQALTEWMVQTALLALLALSAPLVAWGLQVLWDRLDRWVNRDRPAVPVHPGRRGREVRPVRLGPQVMPDRQVRRDHRVR